MQSKKGSGGIYMEQLNQPSLDVSAMYQTLLADFIQVQPDRLKASDQFIAELRQVTATPTMVEVHPQMNQGDWILIKWPEIRLEVFTYPAKSLATVDLYAPKEIDLDLLFKKLVGFFEPSVIRKTVLSRGILDA
ncbi:MAG TPA: S-adenosylmethionine decarboxylase [Acidobacteriota bacterium]|nr:S-adenosylmethionine decarboxylase [Acidobacteriota bacterium]